MAESEVSELLGFYLRLQDERGNARRFERFAEIDALAAVELVQDKRRDRRHEQVVLLVLELPARGGDQLNARARLKRGRDSGSGEVLGPVREEREVELPVALSAQVHCEFALA